MKTTESINKMLFQWSGLALILGGVMGALGQYFHPADPQGPADLVQYVRQGTPVHTALYFVVLLILLGLPAVYVRQHDKVGIAGLAGFLLLFFGLPMVDLVHSIIMFGALPTLVAESPDHAMTTLTAAFETPPWVILEILGFPLAVLGILFFNITTIRARVLPTWPAWLMLTALSAPLSFMLIQFVITWLALRPGRAGRVGVGALTFFGLFYTLAQAGEPILLRQFQAGGFDVVQFVILLVNILSATMMLLMGIRTWRTVPASQIATTSRAAAWT